MLSATSVKAPWRRIWWKIGCHQQMLVRGYRHMRASGSVCPKGTRVRVHKTAAHEAKVGLCCGCGASFSFSVIAFGCSSSPCGPRSPGIALTKADVRMPRVPGLSRSATMPFQQKMHGCRSPRGLYTVILRALNCFPASPIPSLEEDCDTFLTILELAWPSRKLCCRIKKKN